MGPPQSAPCQMLHCYRQRYQDLRGKIALKAQLLARRPHVVIAPTLLLALLLTGGILGVQYSIQSSYGSARATAQWAAQVQVREARLRNRRVASHLASCLPCCGPRHWSSPQEHISWNAASMLLCCGVRAGRCHPYGLTAGHLSSVPGCRDDPRQARYHIAPESLARLRRSALPVCECRRIQQDLRGSVTYGR